MARPKNVSAKRDADRRRKPLQDFSDHDIEVEYQRRKRKHDALFARWQRAMSNVVNIESEMIEAGIKPPSRRGKTVPANGRVALKESLHSLMEPGGEYSPEDVTKLARANGVPGSATKTFRSSVNRCLVDNDDWFERVGRGVYVRLED